MNYAKGLRFVYLFVAVLGWLTAFSQFFGPFFGLALGLGTLLSLTVGIVVYFSKSWKWGLGAGIFPIIGLALPFHFESDVGLALWFAIGAPLQLFLSARAFALPITPAHLASAVFTVCGLFAPIREFTWLRFPAIAAATVVIGVLIALSLPKKTECPPELTTH